MWQKNIVSLLGCGAVLLIWLVSAIYLAPSMQSHVQSHGDQLLELMDSVTSTNAEGLSYSVRGVSDDRKARIRVYEQLADLHPIVSVRVDMRIIDSVQEQEQKQGADNLIPVLEDYPLTAPSLDADTMRCEELRQLDPNVRCH